MHITQIKSFFFFTKASPKFSRSSKSYIMEITLIYMDIEILNMQN